MITYSLLFGVAAWILPIFAIRRKEKQTTFVMGSFTCCCVSAVWQLFEIQKRANNGDFSGIEDTIGAVILGVIIMMAVTLISNFLALKAGKR